VRIARMSNQQVDQVEHHAAVHWQQQQQQQARSGPGSRRP
jgi:hypothetical protein